MLTWMRLRVTGMKVKHHYIHRKWGKVCQFGYFEPREYPTSLVRLEVLATPKDEAKRWEQVCPRSNK